MNLVLTGASGFVGRNFLRRSAGDGRILAVYCKDRSFPEFVRGLQNPNIVAVACDLGNPAEVADLFDRHGREWDSCLYLAGKVDIPWSVREPKQDLLLNAGALLNFLEHVRARRFVYFSSGAVYDGLEGEVHPRAPIAPTLPYAISKMICERYVHFYQQRRGSIADYLIVRFFGAYGPYEAPHKLYSRLVRAFAIDAKHGYTVYGDGQNLIDAMYIDDAVAAIQCILRGDHWNDTINLAGGRPLTIETLVREVGTVLGIPSVSIEKQGIANEKNHFWGSTQEMRQFFAFEPKVTLQEGIIQFKDFLLAQP